MALEFCSYAKVEISIQPLTSEWMDFQIIVRTFLPEEGDEETWHTFTEFEHYYAFIDIIETQKWGNQVVNKYRLIVIPHKEPERFCRRGVIILGENLTQAIELMASEAEYWEHFRILDLYKGCGYKTDRIIKTIFVIKKPIYSDR